MGESRDIDREVTDLEGEDGCDGAIGRSEASSSASRGREPSLRIDGVRDRERKESETESYVESTRGGTGIEGYGLLASRRRSRSAEFA